MRHVEDVGTKELIPGEIRGSFGLEGIDESRIKALPAGRPPGVSTHGQRFGRLVASGLRPIGASNLELERDTDQTVKRCEPLSEEET